MQEDRHPTSPIRAILLDAGGTIIGPRGSYGEVYAQVLQRAGLDASAEAFEKAIHATMAAMEAEIPAGTDRFRHFPGGEAEFWLRFARRAMQATVGREVDTGVAVAALRELRTAFRNPEVWEVFPDVVPTLRALRERGVRLAVVSNWDGRLPEILDMLELTPLFDTVVVSHLEGVEKPHPRIFQIALERLGISADEALHIGDRNDQDIAGAKAAGVRALRIDRVHGEGDLRDFAPLLDQVEPL